MPKLISFFLPIRKGSKRVKNKNLKKLPGYKYGLTELKIKHLQKFRKLAKKLTKNEFEYVVSTDCDQVIKFLHKFDWIKIHKRSKKLAGDDSLDELIRIVPKICSGHYILWTHVTSPFFDDEDYFIFLKYFLREKHNSAFSADLLQKFIFSKKKWISHNRKKRKWPRTQDLNPVYIANSASFIANRKVYLKNFDRICENPLPIITKNLKGMDIDDMYDFRKLEKILNDAKKNN
tara:strand:- start:2060 stop:2758 length:699 start_codon:yes stop_codon:yes gene_type:complete